MWPLALIGVALFEIDLGNTAARRTRLRCGWLFAAGWLYPGMAWMWFLSAPGYLLAAAFFAILHGAAAVLAPRGPWRTIGRPLAHTLVEAVRFCFPFGGVPLASIAIGQSAGPLVGVARVGGPLLLTWVTLQLGWCFADAGRAVLRAAGAATEPTAATPRSGRHAAGALLTVAVVLALAAAAPRGHDIGRPIRVAIVQGGGPQGTHAEDVLPCDADGSPDPAGTTKGPRCVTARHLVATRTLQLGDDVDVVVWPENVIDVVDFGSSTERAEIAAEAARLGATFLVGVTEDVPDDRFTNAQVVVTADGEYADRYEKVRRVPFGEYVPLRGLLQALGAPTDLVPRNAIAGSDPAFLTIPDPDGPRGMRVAVAISWEIFFAGRARDGVSHGGQFLINPTNGSSYTWTILQSQQIASSRLRAIETGRWVVQAAPTGFSAFVSPDGRVTGRTAISEQRVVIREVPRRTGDTWYARIGDIPWVVLGAVALILTRVRTAQVGGRGTAAVAHRSRTDLDHHGDGPVVDE